MKFLKPPKPETGLIVLRLLSFIALISISLSFTPDKLSLVFPTGGVTIPNNIPTLMWSPVACDYYLVRVDNLPADTVRSTLNMLVPFPLSFGNHTWQVEAVTHSGRIKSNKGTFIVDDQPLIKLPAGALLLRHNWKMQSSLLVKENGEKLSVAGTVTKGWFPSSLPVTVLSALVRNGIYPDPYKGMNNMRIPDSNDAYNKKYDLLRYSHIPGKNPWKDPYWFITEFVIPATLTGTTFRLNFSEINYRADVWLNGKQIADHQTMEGMERLFSFDVTDLLKTKGLNCLAVAIYPVDNPGEPGVEPLTPLGEPGTNMGDGWISKSYTKWDAIGWDWQPAIRDRDMGITGEVYLSAIPSVELTNLYVTADLPLPDTTSARVQFSADLINHSDLKINGFIKTTITGGDTLIVFSQPFSLEPRSTISFDRDSKSVPELLFKNPRLWWPFGYGKQNLYTLKMEAISGGKTVVSEETQFGIRELETYVSAKERVFRINGQEIYCKGGNWVIDMMLNWNATRYEDEILLTRNANLNMLRVWGPTGVPPEAFYNAADKYGVLIWQDFLNDYWGTMRNAPGYSTGDSVYYHATVDIVRKNRNHPSLVIWCGGNEGPNPREEIITKNILPKWDGRSSRYYLKISNGDGLHGGGPYHTLSPEQYFSHRNLNGFSSEIGPSGVPDYESTVKFMPDPGKNTMEGRFPMDVVWAYHDANDWPGRDTRKFSSYDNLVRKQYGDITARGDTAIREYFGKAQLVNYEVYRAAIESINRGLWGNSSGILLWKSNSSWPSMTWQLYDWYLQAHAGYYGAKSAGEPLHIQMNRDNMQISLINTLHRNFYDLQVKAVLLNLKGEPIWRKEIKTSIAPLCNFSPGWLVPVTKEPCFLILTVTDEKNNRLSHNLYCISSINDYQSLKNLPEAKLTGTGRKIAGDGRTTFNITLTNTGNSVAYSICCKLREKTSGVEMLPALWSKNYVTLLPGESVSLDVNLRDTDLSGKPEVSCKAYNMVKPEIVEIEWK